MQRINQKDLENVLGRINTLAGFDNPEYSTVGSYCLDWAYGGVQLQKYVSTRGGVTVITPGYNPKKETFGLMQAFCRGMMESR